MSCPDWFSLAEHRDEIGESCDDDARWQDALAHFDAGCPRCREQALDAEPTLLFRDLPTIEVDAADIAAMQQAVATLRRGREVEAPSVERRRAWERRAGMGMLRAAAVAAVLVGATWIGLRAPDTALPAASLDAAPSVAVLSSPLPGAVEAARLPLVEDADPAFGDLIQVEDAEISIVMVLPPVSTGRTSTEQLDV